MSFALWYRMWYRFDDAIVTEISPKFVINQSNYVLFYQRQDVPPEPQLLRRYAILLYFPQL